MSTTSILKMIRNFRLIGAKYSTDETFHQMRNTIFDDVIHRYFEILKFFFNIWSTWWGLIRKKHERDVQSAVSIYLYVDGPWLCEPLMWAVLNEANRKQAEQFHRITEGESWKNCCTIRISKIKHTHINNLRWWGISATEYLTPIRRKFLIICSIDAAGMGQRRRIFWFEVAKVMIVTKK